MCCVAIVKKCQELNVKGMEFCDSILPGFVKHWLMGNDDLHFDRIEGNALYPGVFLPLWEARRCFLSGFYLATVSLASAAVEIAINSDVRIQPSKPAGQWLNLNRKTLLSANKEGLPVTLLLENDEMEKLLTPRYVPSFVHSRNKVAHGDITETPYVASFVDSSETEKAALDHLVKAQAFIVEWAKSVGNPVVDRDLSNKVVESAIIKVAYDTWLLNGFNPYDPNRWT